VTFIGQASVNFRPFNSIRNFSAACQKSSLAGFSASKRIAQCSAPALRPCFFARLFNSAAIFS